MLVAGLPFPPATIRVHAPLIHGGNEKAGSIHGGPRRQPAIAESQRVNVHRADRIAERLEELGFASATGTSAGAPAPSQE